MLTVYILNFQEYNIWHTKLVLRASEYYFGKLRKHVMIYLYKRNLVIYIVLPNFTIYLSKLQVSFFVVVNGFSFTCTTLVTIY